MIPAGFFYAPIATPVIPSVFLFCIVWRKCGMLCEKEVFLSINSLWLDTFSMPDFPALSHSLQAEVLIVGGGLTGLLCAWMLQQEGVDCALVEARSLCGGVTGHTTAKLTAQHGLLYQKLYRRLGAEGAANYLRAQQEALRTYEALSARFTEIFHLHSGLSPASRKFPLSPAASPARLMKIFVFANNPAFFS